MPSAPARRAKKGENIHNAPVPRSFVPEAVEFGRSASITGAGGARARRRGQIGENTSCLRDTNARSALSRAPRSLCSTRRDASRVS